MPSVCRAPTLIRELVNPLHLGDLSTNNGVGLMARMRAYARRRQLLEVAADVFSRKGYHGATTAELAREAGITEPILYRHFANKLDLFATLIDEIGNEVLDAWQNMLEATSSPAERLRVLLTANPAVHERGQGVYRVIFHAMTTSADDVDIRKTLRQHLRKLQTFVADELTDAQSKKLIDSRVNTQTLSWMLVHMAIGYGMVGPLDVPGHSRATGAGRIQDVLATLLGG